MTKVENPLHERLVVGIFLAAAAGGLDAYTYLFHGEVFAGLQTGNFILLGLHFGEGNWYLLPHYLVPIFAFLVGSFLTRTIQHRIPEDPSSPGKRQKLILSLEILLMVIVAVLSPYISDMLTSAILSVAAAAQLQEFRRLNNGPFTSLMMTGNLRTVGESLFGSLILHDRQAGKKLRETVSIIFSFVTGAAINGFFGQWLGDRTIIISAIILIIPVLLLHFYRSDQKSTGAE